MTRLASYAFGPEGPGEEMESTGPSNRDLIDAANALARLLGDSTPLAAREAHEIVRRLAVVAPSEMSPYEEDPAGFADRWTDAARAFTGQPGLLKLEESFYKSWTEDASHPLKGSLGHAWGDSASHMNSVLERFGMRLPQDEDRAPDHIAVLLEFLGFLIERGRVEEVREFRSDHLDWLPDLKKAGEDLELPPVFADIIDTAQRLTDEAVR